MDDKQEAKCITISKLPFLVMTEFYKKVDCFVLCSRVVRSMV